MRSLLTFMIALAAASSSATTTIPFDLVDNRVLVPVMLNGKGPYRMILDTGAGGLLVRAEVANELGLPVGESGEGRGVGQAVVRAWSSRADAVAIKGVGNLGPLACRVMSFDDAPSLWGSERLDGVIGMPVFTRWIVHIDYTHRRITFDEPSAFRAPKHAMRVPFTLRGHTPVISARAGDVAGNFGVDTGARSSLILNGPFVERHRLREKFRASFDAITGWGIGGAVRAQLVRLPSLRIGSTDVKSVVARLSTQTAGSLTTDTMDGLIGGQLLGRFDVTFDYSRSVMLLEKTAAFARADRWDGTGMWLGQRGAIFEVLDVIENGPAANAGLRVGDEVLAIDGRRVASLSLPAERLRLYDDGTPRTIALTVRRGAAEKEVRLRLRRLV